MKTEELREAVAVLPAYESWQSATSQNDLAYQARPHTISHESGVEDLKAQLAFLQTRDAVIDPANQLMTEVAQARSTIPLAFRLAMLRVIDRPIKRRIINGFDLDILNGSYQISENDDIKISDFAWPPTDPFERATRIGTNITGVLKQLGGRKSTPLASLHFGRPLEDLTVPTIADYYLVHPTNRPKTASSKSGFPLEEPAVHDGKVSYELPRLQVTKAGFDPKRGPRFTPWLAPGSEDSLTIPQIEQLQGRRQAGKLLLGRHAVSFAVKDAARREAEQLRRRARNSLTHPLDQRY